MSVFTAYFCGTSSHRFDHANPNFWSGELVATLARHDQGREFAHWVAVDGPGSGNLQDDDLFVTPGGYFQWTGQLFGKGWEENVGHVLQMIKGNSQWQRTRLSEAQYLQLKKAGVDIADATATGSWLWRNYDYGERLLTPQSLQEQIIKMFRKPIIPTQVNLVGWSRGAISCHMLANAMADDLLLKDVPVNIFAIDPVPGILQVSAHRVKLQGNVREYVGFYSRDERSRGFACVVPRCAEGTRVHLFPMPGRHGTLVGNASLDGVSPGRALIEPGRIVRHCAEVCLTRWGVVLSDTLRLSDGQLKAYHAAMAQQDAVYVAMRKHSYTRLTEGRGDDRAVHHGDTPAYFSAITGEAFEPPEGLALSQLDGSTYSVLG